MEKEISPKMSEIERKLLDALLEGDDPILDSLRAQLAESKIESRELSGSGFFLNFEIPDSVPKINPDRIIVGDVFLILRESSTMVVLSSLEKMGIFRCLRLILMAMKSGPISPAFLVCFTIRIQEIGLLRSCGDKRGGHPVVDIQTLSANILLDLEVLELACIGYFWSGAATPKMLWVPLFSRKYFEPALSPKLTSKSA